MFSIQIRAEEEEEEEEEEEGEEEEEEQEEVKEEEEEIQRRSSRCFQSPPASPSECCAPCRATLYGPCRPSGRFSWRASAAANAPGARASNGTSPMSIVSTQC